MDYEDEEEEPECRVDSVPIGDMESGTALDEAAYEAGLCEHCYREQYKVCTECDAAPVLTPQVELCDACAKERTPAQ